MIKIISFIFIANLACMNHQTLTRSIVNDSLEWQNLKSVKFLIVRRLENGVTFEDLNKDEMTDSLFFEANLDDAKSILNLSIPTGRYNAHLSGLSYGLLTFEGDEIVKIKMNTEGFQIIDSGEYFVFSNDYKLIWEEFYLKNIMKVNSMSE